VQIKCCFFDEFAEKVNINDKKQEQNTRKRKNDIAMVNTRVHAIIGNPDTGKTGSVLSVVS